MSMFSSFFTRAKGAIATGLSVIPVVGGVASRAVENIHTGDEHFDEARGVWVSNSTGNATVGPPSAALQSEVDRVNAQNAAILAAARQSAADSIARIGTGAAITAAAAVGPDGNVYSRMSNPAFLLGALAVILLLFFLVFRK